MPEVKIYHEWHFNIERDRGQRKAAISYIESDLGETPGRLRSYSATGALLRGMAHPGILVTSLEPLMGL